MSKKATIITFTCDLLILAFFFFILGEVGVFQQFKCLLASVRDFFQFYKKFQIDALLDFQPSLETGKTTQHGHTQATLRGKPTYIERRV
jgi:hypothetical protein